MFKIVKEDTNKKKDWKSYVKEWAELSWETGHPYNDDDFEDFKLTLQDDGYNLTDSEYDEAWDYYWECYYDCQASQFEDEDEYEDEEEEEDW